MLESRIIQAATHHSVMMQAINKEKNLAISLISLTTVHSVFKLYYLSVHSACSPQYAVYLTSASRTSSWGKMWCCNMAAFTYKPPSVAQSQTRESWSTACGRLLALLTLSLLPARNHVYTGLYKKMVVMGFLLTRCLPCPLMVQNRNTHAACWLCGIKSMNWWLKQIVWTYVILWL